MCAARALLGLAQFAAHGLQLRQQRLGAQVEQLARGRGRQAVTAAVKQAHAQLALQLAQQHAQRRLGHVQSRRGGRHAALLVDGDKAFQAVLIHILIE